MSALHYGYRILVKRKYKDEEYIQTIIDKGEYYMRYALFMALLESHADFDILPMGKEDEKNADQ